MKQYYMFDCMDTIINVNGWESSDTDALWSFEGSCVERYWNSFQEYVECYRNAKKCIDISLPKYKEYEMKERFVHMISNFQINEEERNYIVKSLYENLWKTYTANCYVEKDVFEVLPELSKKITLIIVSNFKIMDGIEKILEYFSLSPYFSHIITSAKSGWRKPHEKIYMDAIEKCDSGKREAITFIGDNYECDYLKPNELGIEAILLDRKNQNKTALKKISTFYELLNTHYIEI
jgi:putative hydrolase of the HAD superfamily